MPGEPVRVLAAFAVLFLVACGEPQAQGGDSGLNESAVSSPENSGSQYVGVYRMVSFNGEPLPSGGISSGFMEFGSDWTWELSVSPTDLAVPVTSSGGFSIGGIKDECLEVVTWPDGSPDRKSTVNVCDGNFTLDPSHADWLATFKRGQ
jgi:hypothetical protein